MSLLLDLIITVISAIIIGICVHKIINCYDDNDEKDSKNLKKVKKKSKN